MPSELHEQLVQTAAQWLRKRARCGFVLCGLSACREIPDAIGWRHGRSTLVECKASYSDFQADAAKRHRREPQIGVGAIRFYMARPGVIPVDELPEGWGLLEARPGGTVRVVTVPPKGGDRRNNAGFRNEVAILSAALRRVQIRLGDTTLDEHLAWANRPATPVRR